MGRAGLEHSPDSKSNTAISEARVQSGVQFPEDSDLARLLKAWPSMTADARAAVLAVVDAAAGGGL